MDASDAGAGDLISRLIRLRMFEAPTENRNEIKSLVSSRLETTQSSHSAGNNAFIEVMRRHPIYDYLFARLSAAALICIGATSRQAHAALLDYKQRTFNPNKLLEMYFSDPIGFRSLQAQTHTLISGSSALQFLDRTVYPKTDLDLFVHPGEQGKVSYWLIEHEGYKFVQFPWQSSDLNVELGTTWEPGHLNNHWPQFNLYRSRAISNVLVFKKGSNSHGNLRKVEIIVPKTNPFHSVLDFHSTCVMNFLTWNAAYSLYPCATFEQRRALSLRSGADERVAAAFAKYAARGYRIVPTVYPHEEGTSAFSVGATRWPGDPRCWVLRLDTTGVTAPGALSPASGPPLTFDPVEQNTWTITHKKSASRNISRNSVRVYYTPVITPVFRYAYVIADIGHLEMINFFTDVQEKVERLKCPEGSHPAHIWEHWSWWDSELPAIRKAYFTGSASFA